MFARRTTLFVIVFVFAMSPASFSQQWQQYVIAEDHFAANFPGEPVATEITWETEYGAMLPARVHTVEQGPAKYSVTVVDYNPVREILTAKSEQCPPGQERCDGLTSF